MSFKKVIATIAIATMVTGCASGQMAQTRLIKQVTDGVEAQSDEIRLRNVKVIKSSTSVSINNLPATYTAETSELLRNKPITFVGQVANADAFIENLDKTPGYRIPVTFTFANAAPVTLDTLIVNGDGIYENLERYGKAVTTVETNP
jgi:hypothetical protein